LIVKFNNYGAAFEQLGNYRNNKTGGKSLEMPEKNSNIEFNRFKIHKVKPAIAGSYFGLTFV